MARTNEFVDHLVDLLSPLGGIRARAMFGGFGIFREHLMFGLVVDNVFYLKVDDTNRSEFEKQGLEPFVHEAKGRTTVMSYYQCPEDAIGDGEELREWATAAFQAAERAAAGKSFRRS
jgi:DNA transformation protein and related proteins